MLITLTTVPPVRYKLTGGLSYGKNLLLSYFAIFTIFPHTKKMAAHLSSQNRGTENSSQNHSGANYQCCTDRAWNDRLCPCPQRRDWCKQDWVCGVSYAPNRFFYLHLRTVILLFRTKERTFVYQGKVRSFFIFWGKNAIIGRETGKKQLNGVSERSKWLHRRSFCVCRTGFRWHTKVRCLPR